MDQAALGLRNTERRRLLIASILIATYLLTCAFVMAMGAIISMYGGAPKAVGSSGYIAVTGLLCLALDLVHLKYGVEVHLGNDVDENSSAVWTMFTACFGSCFVVVEVKSNPASIFSQREIKTCLYSLTSDSEHQPLTVACCAGLPSDDDRARRLHGSIPLPCVCRGHRSGLIRSCPARGYLPAVPDLAGTCLKIDQRLL